MTASTSIVSSTANEPPNAHLALVEREKITEYLLNPEHPDNGGKAAFLITLGFDSEKWEILAAALRELVLNSDVELSMETIHGKKYIVDLENRNSGQKNTDGANDLDNR